MKWIETTLASMLVAFFVAVPPSHAQAVAKKGAPATYTVGEGETVMAIARKLRYEKATEDQMAYAIVRANPNAFSARTKQRLLKGAKLTIPGESDVLATKADAAERVAGRLRQGEARYQDALAAEKAGDMKGAVKAYVESARLGHPLADLRLGQLYDKDNSKTLPRDLQESISHYQKAREFGIEIQGPDSRAPQPTKSDK